MSVSAADLAFAIDLFDRLGAVRVRRMFGGAGLYAGEVMFALVDGGRIFLKTDEALRSELAEAGSEAWVYMETKGAKAGLALETSYWSLPDSACDDADEAAEWGRRAIAVAEAIKAAKLVRKPRGGRGSAKPDN
jgi:DNA transformation protein